MIESPVRVKAPIDGDELATVVGFLDYFRGTLLTKAAGLDAAQLDTALPPSTMTLGGLVKHLAYVEDHWFTEVLAGRDPVEPWASVDWDADLDWDWHSASGQSPEDLLALWEAAVARSRAEVDRVVTTAGAAGDDPSAFGSRRPGRAGRPISLRWILLHMIEEYARHAGHADLIRESIDGTTGD